MRRVTLSILNPIIGDFLILSLESTLAVKLKEDFQYDTSKIGLIFSLFFVGMAFTSIAAMCIS